MHGRIPIKNYLRESRVSNSRVILAGILILLLVTLLLVRLIHLQVVNHRYYSTLSQENRIRPLPIQPVRGLILDRNGVVLAQNYPVFTLEVIPERVKDMDALLAELGEQVTLTEWDLKGFRRLLREKPRHEALALRNSLSEEEAARIALHRLRWQGVELNARLQRYYPLGGLGVHALGYVGRINEQEQQRIDKAAYKGVQHIGKLGIELSYEDLLMGKVGFEQVEADAHGRVIRVLDRIAPVAGQNLYLHLDAKMQALAEESLGTYKGSVVALDTQTGGVLAFASTPTYDPNLFINGIDVESYQRLRNDKNRPLINRALNGRYSPGSTIKPFFGLMGLASGEFNSRTTVDCPGWFTLPGSRHRFRCWKKEGHGPVDLHDAIVQSCDVYFYKLAVTTGIDRMKEFLSGIGFGEKTGVDIEGEASGLVPSPEWRRANRLPWYPGETVVTGIGQGPTLVTPLQLAATTTAIANRGRRVIPQLLRAVEDPTTKAAKFVEPAPPAPINVQNQRHFDEVIRDMTDVVHSRTGTAQRIGYTAQYKIAGKTGTAQVRSIGQNERYIESETPEEFRDHALFIAFAPVEDPKIAVAVIVENGGHGSTVAAPIARRLMDYYLLGTTEPIPKPAPVRKPVSAPAATPAAAPAPEPGPASEPAPEPEPQVDSKPEPELPAEPAFGPTLGPVDFVPAGD